MPKISFSQNGQTPFQKLLGHNKEVMEKWLSLEDSIFSSDTFTAELREEVRRTLAFNNGCQYCMAKGSPTKGITDSRINLATHFADMCTKDTYISDSEFAKLQSEFSDSEISELAVLICFITAYQRFGAIVGLEAGCEI